MNREFRELASSYHDWPFPGKEFKALPTPPGDAAPASIGRYTGYLPHHVNFQTFR